MKQLETFLKLIIIGILAALVRAYGQSFIPIIEEPLLWPSIFADGGITTLAFIGFGTVIYTAIASLFLLMNRNMRGNKVVKGLRFSFFLIIIWTAYSLEPLPHVTFIEKIAYPLVEGVVLLILGILAGALLGTSDTKNQGIKCGDHADGESVEQKKSCDLKSIIDNILSLEELEDNGFYEPIEDEEGICIECGGICDNQLGADEKSDFIHEGKAKRVRKYRRKIKFSVLNVIIIGLFFFLGRLAMYRYFSIYSYFGTHALETLAWVLCTGLAIGVVFELASIYICNKRWYLRFLVFGAIYLVVILTGFNGFKPIIYRMDTVDLALRTLGDCASVILAGGVCLIFDFKKHLKVALKRAEDN